MILFSCYLMKPFNVIAGNHSVVSDSVYVHVSKLKGALIVKEERDYYVTLNGIKDDHIEYLNVELQKANADVKKQQRKLYVSTGGLGISLIIIIVLCLL